MPLNRTRMPLNRTRMLKGYKNITENIKCLKRAFKLILERVVKMDIKKLNFFEGINNICVKKNDGDYFEGEILMCCNCKTPKSMHFPSEKESFKNKIVPIMCECRKLERQKELEEENSKKIADRINFLISKGMIDVSHLEYDISQDDKTNEKMTKFCESYLKKWDEVKSKGIGAIFTGDVGTGKTFYACCIAKELMKKGENVCLTNFSKILDKYKGLEEDSHKVISMVYNSTFLVIDDFGIERRTEFANEKIYEFIDARKGTKLPTIVTTNLSLKEINGKDLNLKRIYSRLQKMCPLNFTINGKDRRVEEAKCIFKDFLSDIH